jgi:hypothetical protein
LVAKPEGKRHLERPRSKWDDIKMTLGDMVFEGVDLIRLVQHGIQEQALVNTVKAHRGS